MSVKSRANVTNRPK